MPTVTLESQKNTTMSKAKVKSAKKRVAEEDNDQVRKVFLKCIFGIKRVTLKGNALLTS